jgi:hypothetical protein
VNKKLNYSLDVLKTIKIFQMRRIVTLIRFGYKKNKHLKKILKRLKNNLFQMSIRTNILVNMKQGQNKELEQWKR